MSWNEWVGHLAFIFRQVLCVSHSSLMLLRTADTSLSDASLTPSGSFASLFSTGTGSGSVYDSISVTNDGLGLLAGTASNGQTVWFDEATGVLSFSAVPEPSAVVLGGIDAAVAWRTVRRRKPRMD